MQLSDLDLSKTYTYADYLSWKLEETVELIKGKIFAMSPAPRRKHQDISFNLSGIFWSYLRNTSCKAYTAPFDVRLPKKTKKDKEIYTVVQPDLCVVCDPNKLDDRGCLGAPDLIVEVLSESTRKKDLNDKLHIYEESGVREYWIVFPDEKIVQVYLLNEHGQYLAPSAYIDTESMPCTVLEGLIIDLGEIFAD